MDRLNRDIGNLEGRLSSMEQRMQQNELHVNAKLSSIDQKVDDSRKEHKSDLKSLGDKQEMALSELSKKHEQSMKEISGSLDSFQDEVRDLLSQTKGGWKSLAWLGTLLAAIAGCVTWILSTLSSIGAA